MARSGSNRKKRINSNRGPRPSWQLVLLHILALGICLVVYAVPHHVIPAQQESIGLTSTRASANTATNAEITAEAQTVEATATPEPTAEETAAEDSASDTADTTEEAETVVYATAEPTATPEPTDDVGEFRIKFADMFTDGEVEMTDLTYKSANINVTFSSARYEDSNINIADIYIADISNLVTAFGNDTYGRGSKYTEMPEDFAEWLGSVALLSGDYYGGRADGVVIRNGTLYRNEDITRDICVLYWDGTMKCFSPSEFDAETELANGAYQAWNFGPMLLDADGAVMTSFNSDVNPRNPRSIIGYFEPGHYCFIMVEGRSDDSSGLTLAQCSQMVYEMGLTTAYNLDGGQTAALVKGTSLYGTPYKGGRAVSDVIAILDTDS